MYGVCLITKFGSNFRINNTHQGIVRMYMAKMSEMCRALYEKATATRLSVRPCDVSQVNCDPDSGKVLLHTVLRPMAYTNDLEKPSWPEIQPFFWPLSTKTPLFMDSSLKNIIPSTKSPVSMDRTTFARPMSYQ